MANARVLVIDDEESMRRTLSILLRGRGYEVQTVDSGAQGIKALQEVEYDVILGDLRMPVPDGFDVLREVKASSPDTEVIIITAYADVETAVQAMRQGAYDYIAKPFEPEHILLAVQKAMEHKTLVQDVRLLRQEVGTRYDLSSIIGTSPAIQDVLLLIKKAITMKSPVLITGESGTGKELVAKAIHYNSPRSTKPLITVNCGAIPASLVESELFGHTKGAFTGAIKAKTGLFEEANGSSLFLDEIGELNVDMQVKLLRTIETGEIRRVGDTRTITFDIRIIAASNRDLEHEVEQGRFREDLYYRLNVLSIHAPPLRERRSDIPLLARRFLKKYAGLYGKAIHDIEPEVMSLLVDRPWRGNVRELEHIIERAVVMCEQEMLCVSDLPFDRSELESTIRVMIPENRLSLQPTLTEATQLIEHQLIERALKMANGNRSQACRLLGISRRALLYKLKEYGYEVPSPFCAKDRQRSVTVVAYR